jgi:hypothetical protein
VIYERECEADRKGNRGDGKCRAPSLGRDDDTCPASRRGKRGRDKQRNPMCRLVLVFNRISISISNRIRTSEGISVGFGFGWVSAGLKRRSDGENVSFVDDSVNQRSEISEEKFLDSAANMPPYKR